MDLNELGPGATFVLIRIFCYSSQKEVMPKRGKKLSKRNRLLALARARDKNPKNIKGRSSKDPAKSSTPEPKPRKRKCAIPSAEVEEIPRLLPFRSCVDTSKSYSDQGPARGRNGGRTKRMRAFKNLRSKRQKNRDNNAKRKQNLAAATRRRKQTVREVAKIAMTKLQEVRPFKPLLVCIC